MTSFDDDIRRLREGAHRDVPSAILVAQLAIGNRREVRHLQSRITYAALGDSHFAFCAPGLGYAGAPVARDACTAGDCGPRPYLRVTIAGGSATSDAISLRSGGYQCKIKRGTRGYVLEAGPAKPVGPGPVIVDASTPRRLLDEVDRVSASRWTTLAITEDVELGGGLVDECRLRYGASSHAARGIRYVTRDDPR